MALSSTHNCFSSAFLTSYIKNQEKSLFTRSKVNFTSSNLFVRSSFLQMKCDFNGYLIPVETGFDDNSTVDGSIKHFKVSPDHSSSPKQNKTTVSVTIVGASGDLAKKKIFPALFALYYENFLPEHFTIFGYARSKMSDEELRSMISKTLTCRIDKRENCGDKMKKFLQRCFYQSGQYDSEENFKELDEKLKEKEAGRLPNRLFYLSIPPNIFVDVVRCATYCASSPTGWTRVIVEKPFGRDSESSRELTTSLKQYLTEDQIFRFSNRFKGGFIYMALKNYFFFNNNKISSITHLLTYFS